MHLFSELCTNFCIFIFWFKMYLIRLEIIMTRKTFRIVIAILVVVLAVLCLTFTLVPFESIFDKSTSEIHSISLFDFFRVRCDRLSWFRYDDPAYYYGYFIRIVLAAFAACLLLLAIGLVIVGIISFFKKDNLNLLLATQMLLILTVVFLTILFFESINRTLATLSPLTHSDCRISMLCIFIFVIYALSIACSIVSIIFTYFLKRKIERNID